MKIKRMSVLVLAGLLLLGLFAIDSVAAQPPEKVDAFVCPVLGGQAGENGMHIGLTNITDGVPPFYTVVGAKIISVPMHATNRLFDADGNPIPGKVHGAPHAAPGDRGYTAIWSLPQ